MFWRFGGHANISTLDTILDKPDVTLEEILDESDLIQELKQHNTKLIEFLGDDDVLRKLLEYVIAPKPAETEPKSTNSSEGGELSSGNSSRDDGEYENETGRPLYDSERDKQEKTRLKYAYVACEVLSSEAWSLSEALMENQIHLRNFWAFLDRPAPLDPLQAGYFTKVNETLLDKKTEEMLDFFRSLEGIVPKMLKH
ncbi:sporulation-induced protein, partial [Rhizina undulata]